MSVLYREAESQLAGVAASQDSDLHVSDAKESSLDNLPGHQALAKSYRGVLGKNRLLLAHVDVPQHS